MPWDAGDASDKTKKADTPKLKKQWAAVANSAKSRGATDKSAIMQANGVVLRQKFGLAKGHGGD
jgi:hypothetical protein